MAIASVPLCPLVNLSCISYKLWCLENPTGLMFGVVKRTNYYYQIVVMYYLGVQEEVRKIKHDDRKRMGITTASTTSTVTTTTTSTEENLGGKEKKPSTFQGVMNKNLSVWSTNLLSDSFRKLGFLYLLKHPDFPSWCTNLLSANITFLIAKSTCEIEISHCLVQSL